MVGSADSIGTVTAAVGNATTGAPLSNRAMCLAFTA